MADIFISYDRADRDRVSLLAGALERLGWSVWWDRHIPPGRTFDDVIEEEIEVARAVICVWTQDAVVSRWVRTEAAEGLSRGVLVPVVMGDVRIPLAFRRIQAADLSDWQPGTAHAGFDELVDALGDVLHEDRPDRSVARTSPLDDGSANVVARARAHNGQGEWDATVRLLTDFAGRFPQLGADPEAVALLDEAQRGCEVAELYREATADAAAGRWSQAIERLDRLAALEPDHVGAVELRRRAEANVAQDRRNAARPERDAVTPPPPAPLNPPSLVTGRQPPGIAAWSSIEPVPGPPDRRASSRWWVAAVVLLVGFAGAVIAVAILAGGGGDDDQGPGSAQADNGIGQNWFGEPAEAAVPALRERGFTVIDYPVCSGSVGAGEVRQIIDSGDGTIYLDTEGITAAGERVAVDTSIEVKFGTGTPCGTSAD